MSAHHRNLSAVKYSLNHNADIHADQDKPLQWAALCGHLSIVEYLISKGANIHAFNDYALRYAIWNNRFKKLISYIGRSQTKKFIDHLTTLLKNSSFNKNLKKKSLIDTLQMSYKKT